MSCVKHSLPSRSNSSGAIKAWSCAPIGALETIDRRRMLSPLVGGNKEAKMLYLASFNPLHE